MQEIKHMQRPEGKSRRCEMDFCPSVLRCKGWILVLFSAKSLVYTCWQCHLQEPLHCYLKTKTQQRVQKPIVTFFILKMGETLLMTEV